MAKWSRHITTGVLLLSLFASVITCGNDNDQANTKTSILTVTPSTTVPHTPTVVPHTTVPDTPTVVLPTTVPSTPTMKIKIQDLFLLIESPDSNEILVNEPSITIVGTTRVDAMVTVNDKIPMLDIDGRFQQEIELDPGANIIEVIASLADGEEKSMVLAVIYVR